MPGGVHDGGARLLTDGVLHLVSPGATSERYGRLVSDVVQAYMPAEAREHPRDALDGAAGGDVSLTSIVQEVVQRHGLSLLLFGRCGGDVSFELHIRAGRRAGGLSDMAAKEPGGVGTRLTHDCGISRSPRAAMRGSVRVGERAEKEPNREGGGPALRVRVSDGAGSCNGSAGVRASAAVPGSGENVSRKISGDAKVDGCCVSGSPSC